ncbi:amino-acid N-acetyltransferase [Candidatus Ishikawella capsulata]|uniref:amino-acid N-acetyltransferase n=1 Tax=Candidatus Ishikawella capsulata TaxID=168169 RepID=UPI00059726AE|nr:amino-acid N-acetyltransferase [Candidatus Ishikawaella capsulata]
MKTRTTELVQGLRHTIPYINIHHGKVFIIMLNGESIEHENFSSIIHDIGLLSSLGIRIVIVYGARPQINNKLKENKIHSIYHKCTRITDFKTLEIIKQVTGSLQLDITARLSMSLNSTTWQRTRNCINVVSGNFITAQPLGIEEGIDYCHSGRIRRIDEESIYSHLDNHAIVLIGPLAGSIIGESFNLTSEEVATQIAIKLQAEKLIGFGPYQGVVKSNNEIISELFPNEVEHYINNIQNINECLCVKLFLRGAVQACRSGVKRSHIISYKENGALLQEIFSREGIGTQIVMQSSEQICRATIDDIGGILQLIRPLEEQGILVRRSRKQLEREIEQFLIIVRDNLIIGCAALYPFHKEKIGELACVAVHPEYRSSERGDILLERIIVQARQIGLKKIFVLTTHSIHWFQERGFKPVDIESLPESKKKMYNYQRRSKVLIAELI